MNPPATNLVAQLDLLIKHQRFSLFVHGCNIGFNLCAGLINLLNCWSFDHRWWALLSVAQFAFVIFFIKLCRTARARRRTLLGIRANVILFDRATARATEEFYADQVVAGINNL